VTVASAKTRLGLDPDTFAQELRRAHCAHEDAGKEHHACVGVCVIERDGVTLTCPACGNGDHLLTEYESKLARSVMEAAGVRWSSLAPEAQRAAVEASKRKP
jgi:hypothetical protein